MRFEEALKAMREGKKVKRLKKSCPIIAEDWEVVDD